MSNSVRKRKPIEHWKIIAFYLIIYDIVAINFSYFFGLLLRFDLLFQHTRELFKCIPEVCAFLYGIFTDRVLCGTYV